MKTISIQASIEEKKRELKELVRRYGFNHEKVLTCSQELDILVCKLMKDIFYAERTSCISEKKDRIITPSSKT